MNINFFKIDFLMNLVSAGALSYFYLFVSLPFDLNRSTWILFLLFLMENSLSNWKLGEQEDLPLGVSGTRRLTFWILVGQEDLPLGVSGTRRLTFRC